MLKYKIPQIVTLTRFRTQFRGVKDRAFFLFRLAKIYA